VEVAPGDDDRVVAHFSLDDERDLPVAVERVRHTFDLDADPAAVYDALGDDPLIGDLVRANPGRRVPGHVDGPELAVRAVLGQQVSVAGAATAAARLVAAHGEPLSRPVGGVTHLFPAPEALVDAEPALPRARVRALRGLARALADGDVVLSPGGDREEAERRLLALPGIGPWTVAYISMRALHWPDAFLASDLGVRRALEALGQPADPKSAEALAERWRPYRAYANHYLWASLRSDE
jgi:AraC family transcriptional regulator, regulatory protein of adaptative response / DNA-3-methyladenine glycosylase II